MWHDAAAATVDHCLFLQDDVEVPPNFWPALVAMLAAVPDQVIGLEAAHPAGKRIALDGHRWYTTSDMLIGPGYVLPRAALAEFLAWRRDALRPGAVQEISEDTLIGVWCLSTGRKIWHPVPTIIDHDTTIASTYGNGAHKNRRPTVTWRDGDVLGFTPARLEGTWWSEPGYTEAPHLGRFYSMTPHLARMWLSECPTELFDRMMADVCPEPYARFR